MRKKMLGLAVAGVLAGVGVFWIGWVQERLLQAGEVPEIDFATLQRRSSPNDFLACPSGLCKAKAEIDSPVFGLPAERLMAAWARAIKAESSVTQLRFDVAVKQFDYVQRTPLMRYPDLVSVRFYELAAGQSSVGIYSRSVYGYGDMGTNRRRVERWLASLRAELARI
jgi:Protein of unknown function (DUF1499)